MSFKHDCFTVSDLNLIERVPFFQENFGKLGLFTGTKALFRSKKGTLFH